MGTHEFLLLLDEVVEVDAGTLKGDERLSALDGWNSLAVVSFMALVDEHFSLQLRPTQIMECSAVSDLLALLGDRVGAA